MLITEEFSLTNEVKKLGNMLVLTLEQEFNSLFPKNIDKISVKEIKETIAKNSDALEDLGYKVTREIKQDIPDGFPLQKIEFEFNSKPSALNGSFGAKSHILTINLYYVYSYRKIIMHELMHASQLNIQKTIPKAYSSALKTKTNKKLYLEKEKEIEAYLISELDDLMHKMPTLKKDDLISHTISNLKASFNNEFTKDLVKGEKEKLFKNLYSKAFRYLSNKG